MIAAENGLEKKIERWMKFQPEDPEHKRTLRRMDAVLHAAIRSLNAEAAKERTETEKVIIGLTVDRSMTAIRYFLAEAGFDKQSQDFVAKRERMNVAVKMVQGNQQRVAAEL